MFWNKKPDPIPEEEWILKSEKQNPFSDYHVKVLEVKQGYVRYLIGRIDSSLEVKTFKRIYEKRKNDNKKSDD